MADETKPEGEMPNADNVTFEVWLESQPDEVKTRIEERTQGLRTALNSERDNSKSLSKQLKELQAAAEKGSELEKQLTALQSKLEESQRYGAFMDSAAGAGCSNAKAAYRIAKADDSFWKRNGEPDWDAIKAEAPELFGKKKPEGNAGSGTGTDPNAGKLNWFDDRIRKKGHR